ncbi:kinase [Clostridioides difficile]|uniref:kinase n=1 Tax=Clostridioides difficile TaxID=1496 RepID=UPI0010336088|nr:kinase [Clostridioides difficile]
MITFDVNGAIIRFDDTKNNYNKIRKIFKLYALEISKNFERDCLNSFQNLKQISDRGLSLGEKYIEESFKKGIETIVSFGIITIDIDTFKSVYCEKYLEFKRLFNNLNKTFNIPNKNKKNGHASFLEIESTIKKMSNYLYNDCFKIHYAVVDALIENRITAVHSYIDEESIKKSNALFNNYKDGFIGKADECKVVKQIITLNPYREDVYEFLVKEDGDFSKEIERLTEFLGYDIREYKASLMDIYINELMESDENDVENAKEKIEKYARYIGCSDENLYVARVNAIYTFANA